MKVYWLYESMKEALVPVAFLLNWASIVIAVYVATRLVYITWSIS